MQKLFEIIKNENDFLIRIVQISSKGETPRGSGTLLWWRDEFLRPIYGLTDVKTVKPVVFKCDPDLGMQNTDVKLLFVKIPRTDENSNNLFEKFFKGTPKSFITPSCQVPKSQVDVKEKSKFKDLRKILGKISVLNTFPDPDKLFHIIITIVPDPTGDSVIDASFGIDYSKAYRSYGSKKDGKIALACNIFLNKCTSILNKSGISVSNRARNTDRCLEYITTSFEKSDEARQNFLSSCKKLENFKFREHASPLPITYKDSTMKNLKDLNAVQEYISK